MSHTVGLEVNGATQQRILFSVAGRDIKNIELSLENERIVAERVILGTPASAARGLYKEPSIIEKELLSMAYSKSVDGSTKVFLAGNYMGMPFTEGAAETGKWAAQTLLRNLT